MTTETRPAVDADKIPKQLRERRQWVAWKLVQRKGEPKPAKVPLGKTSDLNTWTTFDDALRRYQRQKLAGVGFVFSDADQYAGIDLDNCRDPDTGDIAEWAREIIIDLDSYAEVSPSGTGVKVIVRASLSRFVGTGTGRKRPYESGEVEMYHSRRYFTTTGWHMEGTPTDVCDAQAAVDKWWPRVFGEPKEVSHDATLTGPPPPPADAKVLERAGKYIAKIEPAISGQGGSDTTYHVAGLLVEGWALSVEQALPLMHEYNGRCQPPWSERDLLKKLNDAAQKIDPARLGHLRDKERPQTNGRARPKGKPKAAPEPGIVEEEASRTDVANGKRFVEMHRKRVAYVGTWDKWLCYDGRRWRVDDMRRVEKLAKRVARRLFRDVGEQLNKARSDWIEEQLRFAKYTAKSSGISNMLTMARSEVAVDHWSLDRDPWLLNVDNGTLDLRTGNLRQHDRRDHLTKLAPVAFDIDADCPTWLRFLDDIMAGDDALKGYLKRLVGYCLTGSVREHILPVLYGKGANGKSTFVGVVQAMLGDDYSQKAPRGMLMDKRHEAHPTELADLFGRRFLGAVETEGSNRLAESLVKELTGGDRIRARRMREDFWEFDPTHKVWLATNHKPAIRGSDHGIWRRVKLIPFTVTIPDDKQDKALPEKLLGELSGILNWALDGCIEWQHEGLGEPESVRQATDQYRQEQDILGQFIADCCILGGQYQVGAKELLDACREWGARRVNRLELRDHLERLGCTQGRFSDGLHKGRNCYHGIGLLGRREGSEVSSG